MKLNTKAVVLVQIISNTEYSSILSMLLHAASKLGLRLHIRL